MRSKEVGSRAHADSTVSGDTRFPDDRPLPWRSHLILGALGGASFLLFLLLSRMPGVVEVVFATRLSPLFTRLSSRVIGVLPVAVLELLVAAYLVRLAVLQVKALGSLVRRRRSLANVMGRGLLRLIRDGGVAVTLFYVMWGFNYARSPLRDRLGWPAWQTPEAGELAAFAAHAVAGANAAYLAIHDTTDAGLPTVLPPDWRALDRALETGWQRATTTLSLDRYMARRYGPTKRLLSTPVVSRLGISGFYFPWTTEANVLRGSPAAFQPHSIAHEKAHQRGIGPEEEASFLGYVAAVLAPDPHARYSAHLFAQLQLLRVLYQVDSDLARSVAAQRSPGVQRDIDDTVAYWASRRGVAAEVSQAMNHQFLRANRVRGGIASYSQSVQLIITYLQTVPGGR